MIMIIMHHYCVHAGFFDNVQTGNITFNLILTRILSFGKLGNHIFILMTGYFMVKSKVNYKKIIALILEMLFYSIVIDCIFYGFHIAEFKLTTFIKSLFPMLWGSWFLVQYMILYLLIPYINLFMKKINRKQIKQIISILIILIYIVPTFTKNAWGFNVHNIFILDYLVGAYIRLYPIKKFENNKFNLKILLIVSLFGIMSVLGFVVLGKILNINKLIESSYYLLGGNNYSVVLFLMALFIFLIFKNINIKSKIINYISSSVLAVYLIHDNGIIRTWLWQKFWPNINFIDSKFFVLHMITKVLLVFIVCVIIDKIRLVLFKDVEKKLSDKIFELIVKFKNYVVRKTNKIKIEKTC